MNNIIYLKRLREYDILRRVSDLQAKSDNDALGMHFNSPRSIRESSVSSPVEISLESSRQVNKSIADEKRGGPMIKDNQEVQFGVEDIVPKITRNNPNKSKYK